jgi:hypothetical protein
MQPKKKRVGKTGHALDGFEFSKPFIDGGVDALPADAVDLSGDKRVDARTIATY